MGEQITMQNRSSSAHTSLELPIFHSCIPLRCRSRVVFQRPVSDPLPDELVILPDTDVLQRCSVVKGGIPNKTASSDDGDGFLGTSHTEIDNIMEGAL